MRVYEAPPIGEEKGENTRMGLNRPRTQEMGMLTVCGAAALAALTGARASGTGVPGQAEAAGRPVQNAVIWLDAPNAPKLSQTHRVVLDQRNLTFYPHVLAVRVGTTVDFPNNDRVFHNVFSFKNGKRFDLGLYPVGDVKKIKFDQPGLSRIFCNIHPGMAAYVMAVDTPYFAVSDHDGRFTLPSVPAGSYAYHAWRPGGSELGGSAIVHPGTTLEIRWP
jgi:plastocyanin